MTNSRAATKLAALLSVGLGAAFRGGPDTGASTHAPSSHSTPRGSIQKMQRLDREQGFVLTDRSLLATTDGGAGFRDVTPRQGLAGVTDFFFLDADRGWLAGVEPHGGQRLVVLETADSGSTWREEALDESLAPAEVGYVQAYVHFPDAGHGFLMGRRGTSAGFSLGDLLRTSDGGASWERLPRPPAAGPMVFASAEQGFLLGLGSERLYRTFDGGRSWGVLDLGLGVPPGQALYDLPVFYSARQGSLAVTLRGPRPRLLTYSTRDGGRRWQPASSLDLPAEDDGEPVRATFAPSGRPAALAVAGGVLLDAAGAPRSLSLAGGGKEREAAASVRALATDDDGSGWALVASGGCDLRGCRQETRLVDLGAETGTRDLLVRREARDAPSPKTTAAAAATSLGSVISTARGFDKCSAGSVAQMQSWWTASPYFDANIYFGGIARGCAQPNLDASWVAAVADQGWRLIPTWVGPQAPCSSLSRKFSSDPATARGQGLAEADAAVAAADALGLGPTSPLYYDLEAYSATPSCAAAVRSFVDAWSERVRARGYLAGVYGLPRNAQEDWRLGVIANPPEAVWLAYYACTGATCAWTPRVTDIPGLDNTYWPDDQRIVQYWNTHTETWGGVAFTIDANIARGPVAGRPAGLPDVVVDTVSLSPASPVPGQAITFSAVVRNAGAVATPAGVSVGVGYLIEGVQVSWGAVEGPLAAGASVTITTQGGPWTATAGNHTLTALADDVNRFAESDENNNSRSVSFTVAVPPLCTAEVPAGRWRGEYFSNPSLSGSPALVRDQGTTLAFDWGAGSPGAECGLPADGFSSRFTRLVDFAAGRYRFTVSADDGVRVKVGTNLLLEEWRDQVATFTRDITLPAGPQTLVVEHYENLGGALMRLQWQSLEPVVVDDGDPGFALLETPTGRPEWWHRETGLGYGNDMVWTTNTLSRMDNYARWMPVLPVPGRYKVEAHIPSRHSSTTRATYTIMAAGVTTTRVVNQAPLYDVWAELGDHEFAATGGATEFVELGDVTGEPSNTKEVGFDAVRFTPILDAPAVSGWSFPVGSAESGAGWRVTLGLGQSWYSSSAGRWYSGHLAEDWSRTAGGTLGQPVYAAAAGEVVVARQNCGNYVDVVVLKHTVAGLPEPIYSMYGHIETALRVGDRVTRRQQIGVIGDPVTFGPHLHFEIKNHTAFVNPPFSGCSDLPQQRYVSAGYSGKQNDYSGGDAWDPSNDGVAANLYYHPTRFVQARLSGGVAALKAEALQATVPREDDGLPRCTHQE